MKNRLFAGKSARTKTFSVITAVVLVLVIAMNLLVTALTVYGTAFIDMTPEGLYTLRPVMVDACREVFYTEDGELREPGIEITFCNDRDNLISNPYTRVVYYTAIALSKKYDNCKVNAVNINIDPMGVAQYKTSSLTKIEPTDVIISYGQRYRIVSAESFWRIGDEKVYSYDGEHRLASILLSLTLVNRPVAYFVTDHGETYYDPNNENHAGNAETYELKALLEEKGIVWRDCYFDVMLAAYVDDSSRSGYPLEALVGAYLGDTIDESLPEAFYVAKMWQKIEERLAESGQIKLLYEVEMPLAAVLCDMERAGFKIDREGIAAYGEELDEEARALEYRIYMAAGDEFNINSPKQLGEVLFERLMLPHGKKTKTGYSTGADVLEKLRRYHPIIDDILEYRQVTKLKSTYVDGLLKAADEEGRCHTTFKQTGTATGRLSSVNPNLQNIPIRTEAGRRFRKYFIPGKAERVLIDADYSQIELRVLAHVSADENMIDAFLSGEDIHTATSCRVFGVEPHEVTVEMRKRAKAVNFGILYGMGEFSLAEDLKISRAQAKEYIESYLSSYPAIDKYLHDVAKDARADGYVTTMLGRRRYIPELAASNKNLQAFGERVARNSPIQGSSADIIKIAMINVSKKLAESGIDAHLLLQVHDELLIESSRECAEQALEILKSEMESAVALSVPLKVEAAIGENWLECH